MSRWDQRTEGLPRSSRNTRDRNRSRSRSCSPVEQRLRQLDEERKRKERQLRELAAAAVVTAGTGKKNNLYKRSSSGSSSSASDSDSDGPDTAPPPPPIISKVGFSFQKPPAAASAGLASKPKVSTGFQQQQKPSAIQLKLASGPKKEPPRLLKPTANAFAADDSDDEPEEMPAECRMRMRNIGRETPTSSGPNSFGKTKHGFCDSKKIFEKKLNSMTDS